MNKQSTKHAQLALFHAELTAMQAHRAEVAANPYLPESELATIDAAIARIEAKIASL